MTKRRQAATNDDHSSRKKSKPTDNTERRVTRSMTTDAARKAVFNTSELLENILLHLPIRDTIRARQVSHQFKDAIAASPAIQENIFLRLPLQTGMFWRIVGEGEDAHFIVAGGPHDTPDPPSDRLRLRRVFQPNTAVLRQAPYLYGTEPLDLKAKAQHLTNAPSDALALRDDLIKRIHPSVDEEWTRMLLSDPALTSAGAWFKIKVGSSVTIYAMIDSITVMSGVTMKDLLNECYDTVNERAMGGMLSHLSIIDWRAGFGSLRRLDLVDLTLREVLARIEEEHQVQAEWLEFHILVPDGVVASAAEVDMVK